MTEKTFDEFLEERHAKNYHGTDDDMLDAFEAWVSELQIDELIAYAQHYANLQYQQGRIDATREAIELIK